MLFVRAWHAFDAQVFECLGYVAALGAGITVPTPEGPVEMRIPPGSRGGSKLRLKGRGLPGNPAGDLYVVLQIALPAADNDAAIAAYKKMAADLPFDPRADMGV